MRFAVDVTACWRPQRVGMVTVALELARALVVERHDDDVVLLCSRERPARLANLDCDAVLAPHRHELALKATWLPAVEPLLGCDAILYPYWPSPPMRRSGAPPAAIFVHDLAFKLRPREVPWQQRAYFGGVLGRALDSAAAVLVPSETTRRDLIAAYRKPGLDGRVEVVAEGLTELALPGPLPTGLEPGFILAVGTIEPRKNYPRLLEAYRWLRSRGNVPPLVVAGRPGWAYGDMVRRLQIEPGVRYLGHVDEPTLAALYRGAAVLALPSLYEGFGLPLLEAMSCGVPALIGAGSALGELAAGAAIEVAPEDSGAIAAGLQRLLFDSAMRSRLGEIGRRRAASFTWQRSAIQTLDILRRIGSERRRKVA